MAQPQSQSSRESSATESRRTANVPVQRARSGQLAPSSGPSSWAAAGPFGLMRRLSDDMDQLFGELTGAMGRGGALAPSAPVALAPAVEWMPAIDVFECDGQLVVQADLPGVGVDDVTIEVEDDVLTLSGERREEREIDEDGMRRIERRYGRFSRSIALPEGAQPEAITAAFRDGVLEITVPVTQSESQQRRRIDIQSDTRSGSGSSSNARSQSSQTSASGSGNKPNSDTRGASQSGA